MNAALPASPALARVVRGDLCAGCGLCAALAPGAVEMTGRSGFLRPHQSGPVTPGAEAAIAAACPGLGLAQDAAGRTDDPLWGPVVATRTGHAADPVLRHCASSGGALSAVLVHLLDSGTVDAVVQIAADPDNPLGNRTVVSRTAAEVLAAAGSRYAPSAPLAGLEAWLGGTGRHAFVGKPCDVAALRTLGARDARVAERFPVLVSFFCAGVPSLAGAAQVVRALGAEPGDVTAFRYRGHGWPGSATATLADGSERAMSYAESWGAILSHHVQHRCKICPDGTGGFADIVCADAWETDARGYPLFEERDGISLVMSRTALGEQIVQAAGAAGALALAPFDLARLAALQPGQVRRKTVLSARLAGLRLCGAPVPRYRGFQLGRAARLGPLGDRARNFLGMIRRRLFRQTRAG